MQRAREDQHLAAVAERHRVEHETSHGDAASRHLPHGRGLRVTDEIEIEDVGAVLVESLQRVERRPVRRDVRCDPRLVDAPLLRLEFCLCASPLLDRFG
jgi:hypothetical protein